MSIASLLHTFQRYRTLQTHTIMALPVVILMPHSACNCQCVMCDIWKDNKNLKQLTEEDISSLLKAFMKFGTQRVVMSGGEALLNSNFFRFCEMLRRANIQVTLLSTGLSIKRNADQLLQWVNDIIISLDGNEEVHDAIRNIPGAFRKLREGVEYIKSINPGYKITGRTVIHRLNYRHWSSIIDIAASMGLNQISFLPADVSSQAFNRQVPWEDTKTSQILIPAKELPDLYSIIQTLIENYKQAFQTGFIAESPEKIQRIYAYYAACYGLNPFPYKKCNAPWVSTVIEADGTVRPCFFHNAIGNIRQHSLETILNNKNTVDFRRSLDMEKNDTCVKCVCSLYLGPRSNLR